MKATSKSTAFLQRAEEFDFDSAFYDVDDFQDYGEVRYNAVVGSKPYSTPSPLLRAVKRFMQSASAKRPDRSR